MGHVLTLPYLPFTLTDLSPHLTNLSDHGYSILVKSIAFQATNGINHLHGLGIAHRDINPSNIMFDWNGCIKIIDLGIAWTSDNQEKREDGSMIVDVGTGLATPSNLLVCGLILPNRPFRAPELLFSATSYNPFAIDIWALGTTIAGLFLTSSASSDIPVIDPLDDSRSDLSTEGEDSTRSSLFDSTYGDLGLAASIFRVLGTPNSESWPVS